MADMLRRWKVELCDSQRKLPGVDMADHKPVICVIGKRMDGSGRREVS